MSLYYPEGWIIDTPQNRAAMANISTLTECLPRRTDFRRSCIDM